jgi:hypothetical protein
LAEEQAAIVIVRSRAMGEMVLWSVIALNFVFLRDAMPGVEGPRLELGGSRGTINRLHAWCRISCCSSDDLR